MSTASCASRTTIWTPIVHCGDADGFVGVEVLLDLGDVGKHQRGTQMRATALTEAGPVEEIRGDIAVTPADRSRPEEDPRTNWTKTWGLVTNDAVDTPSYIVLNHIIKT